MPKLIDFKADSRFFGLFVGRSSSGKSCAAISWKKPIDAVDFDLRIRGARFYGAVSDEEKTQIDVTSYPPNKSFDDFQNKINTLCLMAELNQWKNLPVTLLLDSLTSQTRIFLTDAMDLTAGREVGKGKTKVRMAGPSDYNFQDQATYQVFDVLRSLPINIIVTAHIVPRYGKLPSIKYEESDGQKGTAPDKDFSESVEIGERLSLTNKLAENILAYFDEVYLFEKEMQANGIPAHYVTFRSDIARTAYPSLPNGRVDITNKNFYTVWKEMISK